MDLTDVVVYVATLEEYNSILEFASQKGYDISAVMYGSLPYPNTCLRFNESKCLMTSDKGYYESYYKVYKMEEFLALVGSGKSVSSSTPVNVSDTNPKAQIGSYSLPMGMISPLFAAHVALGKLNGAEKYGISNYIGTEVVMSIYLDAIQRHLDKIKMGEVVDEVDGVNHFGAIGANCDIILSAQAAGTLIDDRPLSTGQLEAYKALTPMVKQLKELHKGKNPKHYYLNKEM